MLRFFEKLVKPFPEEPVGPPPAGLVAFCRYYTRGYGWPLLAMALSAGLLAVLEVSLFGFMGQLVDWLVARDPETLLQEEGRTLLGMGLLLVVGLPCVVVLHALLVHQTLMGNYPMKVRWLAHRYLLRQSVSFYQDDFAGRIATKVMQTALAVRETVMKLLDVLVYVGVYFIAMLVLVAQADWRLMVPMLLWLCAYIGLQVYFVPRLKQVSTDQAEARSLMTGRIVDSYTNIATIKLFAHTQRESDYARDSMDEFLGTVHRQMRLATGLNVSVHVINYLLSFMVAALAIWLWMQDSVSVGAIAIAVSLALRLNGIAQWIMWEIGILFENIGTVVDGTRTLAQPLKLQDKPQAKALALPHGAIEFDQVRFHYGKGCGVIEQLSLRIQPGQKVGLVGRSGAGKSTLVNLLLRFYDLEGGVIRLDGQNIAEVTQDSLRAQIGMVTQDTSLLHRSVRENLLYGNPQASEAQMIAASKQAGAHDFIQTLTDSQGRRGYDAQVGERGVKLSGRQRQRIAIARVGRSSRCRVLADPCCC